MPYITLFSNGNLVRSAKLIQNTSVNSGRHNPRIWFSLQIILGLVKTSMIKQHYNDTDRNSK